jgi:hypothetical protein
MRQVFELPLHYGTAPPWLFERMKRLASAILEVIVREYSPEEVIRRVSDPFWFQSLGCLLGFDWHSSGLTTTVCGALKEAVKGREKDLGIVIAGGKGGRARKTPEELRDYGFRFSLNADDLIFASRMSAKVDSTALQDGYNLYHHTFIATFQNQWAVIQQGMNEKTCKARRYHWSSLDLKDFVCEPHKAIVSEGKGEALNMVAKESENARKVVTVIARDNPEKTIKELNKILQLPERHFLTREDISPIRIKKVLLKTYAEPPKDFLALLGKEGVGPKTIRALALISDVVYGAKASYTDPFVYSFAHGGKDGYPYRIKKEDYDKSIKIWEEAIREAKLGREEKLSCLRRLNKIQSAR